MRIFRKIKDLIFKHIFNTYSVSIEQFMQNGAHLFTHEIFFNHSSEAREFYNSIATKKDLIMPYYNRVSLNLDGYNDQKHEIESKWIQNDSISIKEIDTPRSEDTCNKHYEIVLFGYDAEDNITDNIEVIGSWTNHDFVVEEFNNICDHPQQIFKDDPKVKFWHLELQERTKLNSFFGETEEDEEEIDILREEIFEVEDFFVKMIILPDSLDEPEEIMTKHLYRYEDAIETYESMKPNDCGSFSYDPMVDGYLKIFIVHDDIDTKAIWYKLSKDSSPMMILETDSPSSDSKILGLFN